jgi:hypothetical protein
VYSTGDCCRLSVGSVRSGVASANNRVTPLVHNVRMQSGNSIEFAHAARSLTREAQSRGLVGPSYRCPPRIVGVDRSIRRHATGVTVAVKLRGRPFVAVLSDMIEGVIVANLLAAPAADRLRGDLWVTLGFAASTVQAQVA